MRIKLFCEIFEKSKCVDILVQSGYGVTCYDPQGRDSGNKKNILNYPEISEKISGRHSDFLEILKSGLFYFEDKYKC